MLFNSFQFLLFFPVVTALYFLLPHKFRWLHLLIASCVFYAAFIPAYLLILLFTIVIDFYAGKMIDISTGKRRKHFLILSIIANVSVLAVFKYYNFFIDNINGALSALSIPHHSIPYLDIILPIGLSFHTFQAMSYTIEIYRGSYKPEKHFGIYALYVMFYPQLVAGPIERPQNILPQLKEKKYYDHEKMVSGLRLILWGLFKKVVIADRLAITADEVFNNSSQYTGLAYLVGVIFFGIQIYCDFSGYSDIAVGSARTMGINLMQNFRMPYFSATISEFWKRWHISLSSWFRDYLYIPLGGNRVSGYRNMFNLFFVFMISGFWHGASWNFVLWGALHGFFLIAATSLHRYFPFFKKSNLFNIVVTFLLVNLAWIFFRAPNLSEGFTILRGILNISDISGYFDLVQMDLNGNKTILALPVWQFIAAASLIPALFILEWLILKGYYDKFLRQPLYVKWAAYYILILAVLLLGVFEVNQFIYFQF